MHLTIKCNVVQVMFGSFNFLGIFLCKISQTEQFFLSVVCIVVESELSIQAEDWNKLQTIVNIYYIQ